MAKPLEWSVDLPEEDLHRHECAEADLTGDDEVAAVAPVDEGRSADKEVDDGLGAVPPAVRDHPAHRELAVALAELIPFAILADKGFDNPDTAERLIELGVEATPFLPNFVVLGCHRFPDKAPDDTDERHGQEDGEGELPREEDAGDEGSDNGEAAGHQVRDAIDEEAPDAVGVLGDAADDAADLLFVEE